MEQSNQECPYIGLIPFSEADSKYFFGRDKEINLIIANMFASRLTILYGKSGVGKSSILNAGVMPKLRNRKDLVSITFKEWRQGASIALKTSLYDSIKGIIGNKIGPLNPGIPLRDFLHLTLDLYPDIRLMVILDQFEDYFLYNSRNDSFSVEFPAIALDRDLPVSFLISIREDSLAKIDYFEGAIPFLFDNILKVDSLSYDDAKDAIIKPIDQYNKQVDKIGASITIEESLADSVLDQIKTGEVLLDCAGQGIIRREEDDEKIEITIETPYLQLVMMRLWREEREANSSILRLDTLNKLGGAKNIIRKHLDDVMSSTTYEEKLIASSVLRYLVTPGGAKISHTISDLAKYTDLPIIKISNVLEKLAGSNIRVISPVAPALNKTELRYEIYHDVLASPILDWRNRFEKRIEHIETKRKTRKKIIRYSSYVLVFLLVGLLLSLSYAYKNSIKAAKYYVNLMSADSQLRSNISQINALNDTAMDRLNRIVESIQLRQALVSGSRERIDSAIERTTAEIGIKFSAEAWEMPYKSPTGKNTFRFRMFPIDSTVIGGMKSIALITYYMDHETFLNPLIAAGPNSKFVGSYDGVGCLTRVMAIIEYTDINKPSTVAQFNMCECLKVFPIKN